MQKHLASVSAGCETEMYVRALHLIALTDVTALLAQPLPVWWIRDADKLRARNIWFSDRSQADLKVFIIDRGVMRRENSIPWVYYPAPPSTTCCKPHSPCYSDNGEELRGAWHHRWAGSTGCRGIHLKLWTCKNTLFNEFKVSIWVKTLHGHHPQSSDPWLT